MYCEKWYMLFDYISHYYTWVDVPVSEEKKITISREELIFTYTDHSTYHRGQILNLLREYGLEGINTDFFSYLMV